MHIDRGQCVQYATPIHIIREASPKVEEEEEEEDIYSPQSVSLPNLSPISSAASSPRHGLSPSPSCSSWTPADEETLQDMSECQEDEGWDKLDDVTPSPLTSQSFKVHIQLEQDAGEKTHSSVVNHSPRVEAESSSKKGIQSGFAKCQQTPAHVQVELPAPRMDTAAKPPPCKHPVRIVPISLKQVHTQLDSESLTDTKESKARNTAEDISFFGCREKIRAASGDERLMGGGKEIPSAHLIRASSLGSGGEEKARAIPINIERDHKIKTAGNWQQPEKGMQGKISKVRTTSMPGLCIKSEEENDSMHQRRASGGQREIVVPVQIVSGERELGSFCVHQSSEERLWGVATPEKGAALNCKESLANKSKHDTSRQELYETKESSSIPFGSAAKVQRNNDCGAASVTIDPFSYTHLPFSLSSEKQYSPPQTVPGQRGDREREKGSNGSFAGVEDLVKMHDQLEVIRTQKLEISRTNSPRRCVAI